MVSQLRRWLLLLLALVLGGVLWWPRPALGAGVAWTSPEQTREGGATLFAEHCVGCHVNGGNVIRRGKTLRLAALGQGQMGGYGEVLGPGGAEAVGAWVWEQALAEWPKSEQKIKKGPQ